ncbi:hypothetical protein M9458_033220, partial [Cirrhinus mrigala]
ISQRLAACQPPQRVSVVACQPVPEPMQIDYSRLSRTERNICLTSGLCLYFSNNGHFIRNCPVKPPRPVVSTILSEVEVSSLSLIPVTFHSSRNSLSVSALIDSDSSGNFISQECLEKFQLTRQRRNHEYAVKMIQGKPLGRGKVQYSSPIITLQVGLFHKEQIPPSASSWDAHGSTSIHIPVLCWDPCDVLQWGKQCHEQCLSELSHPQSISIPLASTKIKSPEPEVTPEIPAEYMVFQDVFSKQAATQLPPHRPWDCAIELLPGAQLPKEKDSPLVHPGVPGDGGVHQGGPTTSFFLVDKKDGGLGHCIDYCQLNSQIIQQLYPVPLVPAALEELRGARVFSKLDLRSAYNLIRIWAGDEWKTAFITPTGHYEYRVMPYGLSISPSVFQTFINEVFREFLHRFVVVYIDDIPIYSRNMADHRQHVQQVLEKLHEHRLFLKLEKCEFHQSSVQFLGYVISTEGVQMDQGKVQAIQDWPTPSTIKELQRFLGFSNLYRRFINGYSMITAPLTSLLRGKPKHLDWNPTPTKPSNDSTIFCTAPLLRHPDLDPSRAVLSQAVGDPPLLHPCAYFSRKLTMVEQNYDVGNCELLAIKLALEEWRHWLEGSAHQFTIITDHKNLQFNFKITYRPGTKYTKADALSRQFLADSPAKPEPILPPDLIVSPIIWDLEDDIRHATLQEPASPGCPDGRICVPSSQRLHLLGTVHESPGSGHPGSRRTLSLLQARYWWPSMHRDVTRYVLSCSVCAMSNTPRHLPTEKLVPLPIPQKPWSHIGVNFVTDLPNSE